MQSLQKSIQSVIDSGRIGSPVFLRSMLQVPVEDIEHATNILITLANLWMPSSPEFIQARRSQDDVQLTTMIQYLGGQTAVLSANRVTTNQTASIDLHLIGNKGVIYHETPPSRHHNQEFVVDLTKATDQ
ncbi:MAG: hypothetical protein VX432_10715, partial [Candidatus Poribacteria bacterium]|nr:hypothetical protein [Candidatus Poribacteria bacterium]